MTDARTSERITMTSGNLSCGAKREKPPRPEEQEESDPCKSPQCYSSSEDDSKTDSVKLCDKEWCWRCWRCGTALSASCIRGCWAPGHLLELVPLSTHFLVRCLGRKQKAQVLGLLTLMWEIWMNQPMGDFSLSLSSKCIKVKFLRKKGDVK